MHLLIAVEVALSCPQTHPPLLPGNTETTFTKNVNIIAIVEHSGSGIELRSLDEENPGLNPVPQRETLGKFFSIYIAAVYSQILIHTSVRCMNEYLAIDSGGYFYEQPSHINCSVAGSFFPEKLRQHLIEQASRE